MMELFFLKEKFGYSEQANLHISPLSSLQFALPQALWGFLQAMLKHSRHVHPSTLPMRGKRRAVQGNRATIREWK